ncbi:TetR/AcrR family transcriptional regulator [Gulosibacter sp. 10]|uniref:TetR/AcrR family transcriptional regulator n=1 Tax=Gulosibacter sp. 10 TaxID=1255570 RepID=UPI00097ED922|nr:TetR/AcrR family transcriptional regulator C-terminal domain-containing protein [Gulosibacter sp. 10]SJM69405.1 Transcriptional regulator, TetR family [Gulosibacter sp. 10]
MAADSTGAPGAGAAPGGGSARPGGRGAGRPRVPVLDRERITTAAIQLLRSGGLAKLTINALAARLGVSPSAIYNHADSRATILVRVQERLVVEIDASGFERLPWREATERWARSYFLMLRRNHALVEVTATVPISEALESARMYERVAYGLRRAGWSVRDVLPTISAIEAFIFGAALDSTAPADIYSTGAHRGKTPLLTAIVGVHEEHLRESGSSAADVAFELGLGALLDGLHARHSSPTVSED